VTKQHIGRAFRRFQFFPELRIFVSLPSGIALPMNHLLHDGRRYWVCGHSVIFEETEMSIQRVTEFLNDRADSESRAGRGITSAEAGPVLKGYC
jgi:hypothetical protein